MAKPMGDPELLKMLGENVIRARGRRSQADIAKVSRVDISTISDLENGQRNPSITTLARIAGALGIEVVDLFRSVSRAPVGRSLEDRIALLEKALKKRPQRKS